MANEETEFSAAFDRFRALLKKRGVETLACPTCGANEWGAAGDVGLNVLEGRDPETGKVAGIPGSVHAIGVTCAKCGFLCLFDRDVIGD